MPSALPRPTTSAWFTEWTWQPLAIVAVVLLGAWYLRAVRRVHAGGGRWSVGRSLTYGLGLLALLWTTCGFFGAYSGSLFWAWTARTLTIWLLVPALLLAGRPLHLAEAVSGDGWVRRAIRTKPARVLGHPLISPAVVPVLSALLFFGPVASWAALQAPVFGWVLDLVMLSLGTIALLPILGPGDRSGSMAVAGALIIGMVELILDAIPGFALRLQTHLTTSYFNHVHVHSWTPSHLHDQQTAGTILWVVAESIDLPFLVLVFNRWLRADARDAAEMDAVLEAERAARATPETEAPAEDAPWWLTDEQMQRRLRH